MGGPEDLVVRNYLEWSDAGRPAIWRYLAAVVLGFLFWMWGSIPAILLLQDFLKDPATTSVAFEYTFVVGLVAIPLITRYLLKRPAFFAVGQAVLTIVAVEWIVRRRVARVPRATAAS